jgi:hypothetical protein
MTQRLVTGLLMLAGVVCAQHSVDPRNTYHRVICVVPMVGRAFPRLLLTASTKLTR